MERDISVALAQPGRDPSSPGALGTLACPEQLSPHVPAAGWDSPREASQVPALQGCGTMAGFPERLPCSPRCCVLSPPRLALGHDDTQAAPAQA